MPRALALIALLSVNSLPSSLAALESPRDRTAALKELAKAESGKDTQAFLQALPPALKGDDARVVRAVVAAYSTFAPGAWESLEKNELMAFHGKAAACFASVSSAGAVSELKRLLKGHGEWHGRLLVLDASGICTGLDRLESSLTALRDEHPVLMRRALEYLSRAEREPVVEAIIARYLELAKKKGKGEDASQWDRTRFAFQAALQRMLKIDLGAPEDYKNYFEGRKGTPHLFDPGKSRPEGARTGVSLFGAAITGKNIVFVLDISGSMLTTDPLPPGKEEQRRRGRTAVVGGDAEKQPLRPNEPPEERQRMARARKELSSVIRGLPADVRFNIVTYSSDVRGWKKSLVEASDANKEKALDFVEALKADGITVTDQALETAFSDLGIDTVYLITDGAPTHIGSRGPGLPEDAPQLIEYIHRRVAELNFLRGVRLFTLGFREAHEPFLKKLAADNAGKYVAIE